MPTRDGSIWRYSIRLPNAGIASNHLSHFETITDPQGRTLQWSADGRQVIAVGGNDQLLQLWDPVARRMTSSLKGHNNPGVGVMFVAFEPDRRRDVATKHAAWPRLLSACGGELIVWDIKTQKSLTRANVHTEVRSAAWSPDGKWIAVGAFNRLVLLDAETGKELTVNAIGRGHLDGSMSMASSGKTIRLQHSQGLTAWNAETGEQTQRVTDFPNGLSVVSPNDQWLATYDPKKEQDNLWIVDTETCQKRSALRGHTGTINAVNWSPDAKQLATAATDRTVRIWNVLDAQQARQLDHDRAVRTVVWSVDGQQIATCADDDIVRVWSVTKPTQPPKTFPRLTSPVNAGPFGMSWSPDGKLLALACADGGARAIETTSGRVSDPFINFVAGMQCVTWSSDGKQILAANGWEVGYRALTAKDSAVVGGLGGPVVWHADKRRFVTGCFGYYPIFAFDTRKSLKLGTLIPRFGPQGEHWACIAPDGHFRGSDNVESQ